ncbi:MAG: SDR family oxidoreductase [Candidatus Zixiibacteriota bacterium]
MRSLKDKVVVITGASRGIGEGIARVFAAEHPKLVLCGRDKERLQKVAKSLPLPRSHVSTVIADITRASGMKKIIDAAYKRHGVIDVFINNAGVGARKNLLDTTEEDYDLTMDTNLKAVFYSFKMLLPRMLKQDFGHIINISSGAGRIGMPGLAVYSASKAALNAFSEAVAGEVRNDNIKISVLAPSSTDTSFGSGRSSKKSAHRSATVRLTVDEVAEAVLFLAKQNENAFTSMADIRPLITRK